jgi:hypothetical protein
MTKVAVAVLLVMLGLQGAMAQSAKPNPVLVELFTSEGCSSCPPADALLAKLNGKISPSGQQIIALSEHVTYWDQLGWKDPFSQQFFTDRQNAYAERMGQDEVYTPQVVVNGDSQVVGSDHDAVIKAITREGLPMPLTITILSHRPNGANLSVMFTASGKLPHEGADVYAVLADDLDSEQVLHGENAGRTLAHVAVARSVGKSTVLHEGEQTLVTIPLTAALRNQPLTGKHLVLIAQLRGQGRVLGLATEEMVAEPIVLGASATR